MKDHQSDYVLTASSGGAYKFITTNRITSNLSGVTPLSLYLQSIQ
jgi:hypothetical protein